ncbi:phosphotransferase [Amycolatopsis plumensis]|uniref:Phosphotransferase n=1 Tax=Amycolatopsis plumensis TaxID=236508 RepID=A0ABV5U6J7_9PSEU
MATYSPLATDTLAQLYERFGLSCATAEPLAGGAANTSYLITTVDDRQYVLTVLDNHDTVSATRLARLLRHLVDCGVPTSEPLPDRSGQPVATLANRLFLLKNYLPGTCQTQLPSSALRAAGALLARLREVPPPAFDLPVGRRLPADALELAEKFADHDFADWVRTHAALGRLPAANQSRSVLVHGDLAGDNLVLGENGRLAVLDWETAALDLPVVDLGMTLYALCRTDGRFDLARARQLLSGYAEVWPPSGQEWDLLLPAITHAAVLIGYHRYRRHHIRYPDKAKQHLYLEVPPYLADIRTRWPDLEWQQRA